MDKALFNSEDEFNSFINENTGNIPGHGIVARSSWFEPEKYPCVAIWEIEYDGNGPDMLNGEFVYLDDFER